MPVFRELLAILGIEVEVDRAKSVDNFLGRTQKAMQTLGGSIAGYFAVQAVKGFVQQQIMVGETLRKNALALGVSTKAFQEYEHVFNTIGQGDKVFEVMLQLSEKAFEGINNKTSETAKIFKKLGVELADSSGKVRPVTDIFMEFADAIKAAENDTEKMAFMSTLFGEDLSKFLMPLMKQGSGQILEMRKAVKELGGGFSDAAVEGAEEMYRELGKVSLAMTSLKSVIFVSILPAIKYTIESAKQLAISMRKIVDETHIFKAAAIVAIGVLTAVFIKAMSTMGMTMMRYALFWVIFNAPIIAAVVLIGLMILVVDDLLVMFEGGQSVIGEFLDALFGVGTAQAVVETLTNAWKSFMDLLTPGNFVEGWKIAFAEIGRLVKSIPGMEYVMNKVAGMTAGPAKEGGAFAGAGASGDFGSLKPTAKAGNSVNQNTNVVVNLPPGSDKQQAENIKKIANQVLEQRNNQAVAAMVPDVGG